jgi:uncharacterized BrkB/YihY/UPF0761 family membrane protein
MMISVYVVVAGVVVMAILGATIPYVYFLSESSFNKCKKVAQAASVLAVLYSGLAMTLVLSSFILKPTKKAGEIVTYQPWWIESFAPTYFVPKNACQDAEYTFKTRDPSLAKRAVRVIASTVHEDKYETIQRVQSVTSKSGKLGHEFSLVIILLTTAILLLSSLFRCVSTFTAVERRYQSWLFEPVVMYVMFGVLETFINIIYLVGRVDLRFYRPDNLGHIDYIASDETLNGSGTNLHDKTPVEEMQSHNSQSNLSTSV